MQHQPLPMHKSLFLIMGGIFLILSVILCRLFYMQINLVDHFVHRSEKNFLRVETETPPRGNIIDATGSLLATNRPVTNLLWQGSGNRSLKPPQLKTLETIEIIGHKPLVSDQQFMYNLRMVELRYQTMPLIQDLSFEQLSQIEEQLTNNHNLIIAHDFQRYYPYGATASHILGYLGGEVSPEATGQMGLEKALNDILRGKEGTILRTINSVGRPIAKQTIQECMAGDTIQTTIDINLQRIVELVFPEMFTGTLILMDPFTGDIKALVSRPDFDPNIFLKPIEQETWKKLQEKKPFLNRACNATYPPGSIFKLISASAGIEHHYIDPEATFYCPGYSTFADRQYRCHNKQGHGSLSVLQAVAQSCNILFYEMGKKIDIDLLAQYAQYFGLGQKTGIIFPEKVGIVPSRAWKKKTYRQKWYQGETLSTSIGQSFLLVTPMQITRMISGICAGYLTKPRLLLSEEIEKQPLPIKDSTRSFLKKSMKHVVTVGTGRRASTVNIEMYAKTSTAQMSALEKRDLGDEYLEHGWFASFFSYKNKPPLTLVILVEHAGSSQVALGVAKNFLIEYKLYMDELEHPETAAPAA